MARVYQNERGHLKETDSLWEALSLESVPHSVISLVGAGGKTSTMFRLAEECRAGGRRVIVTTSTHIFCPDSYPVALIKRAGDLEKWYGYRTDSEDRNGNSKNEKSMPDILVVAGSKNEETKKLAGLSLPEIGRLRNYCDVLLIEADGSRQLPLKLPAEHEPAVIEETEVVIGCAGLSAIGKRWKDVCFRWERAGQVLGETEEDFREKKILPQDAADILMDENGTRKHVGERCYRILLNQMDGEKQKADAEEILRLIEKESGNEELIIAGSCYL